MTPPTHLVKVGSVVVLTTSKTSTSRMLPVLSYTTMTGRDVPSVFSSVGESGGHLRERQRGLEAAEICLWMRSESCWTSEEV